MANTEIHIQEYLATFIEMLIRENEEKCIMKMKHDPPYNQSGTVSF